MKRPQTYYLVTYLFLTALGTGCNSSSDGPTAEDLLRARQRRETEEIAKSKSPEERLENARQYIADGNPVAAEEELRPLLISDQNDSGVLLAWAQIQAISGRKAEAIETLNSISDEPVEDKVEALWLGSQWSLDLNQFQQAEKQLNRLLTLPGDHVRVLRVLTTFLNNQGRRREAGVHLKSLAKTGEIIEKELISMVTIGNPFLDQSMPKPDFGSELVPELLVMSRELKSQGDFAAAARLTKTLSEKHPDSTQIHAFLGRIYADQQDVKKLRSWLGQVPEGIEIEAEFWHAVAALMELENQPRMAIRCYLEAVLRDETNRPAYLSLAQLLNQLEMQETAAKCLERSESLAEIARIAKSLGYERGTSEELHRIADLMQEMKRPWESFAWRTIALKQQGASEQEVDEVENNRISLLKEINKQPDESIATENFRLCGLRLDDWPLPDFQRNEVPIPTSENVLTQNQSSTPNLIDIAEQTGLYFQYLNGQNPESEDLFIHQVTGGGIGVIDYDLDGWPDLYLAQGGGDAFSSQSNHVDQLFRNQASSQWNEIGQAAEINNLGYAQGVAAADFNQDGWPDLLVANLGDNILYKNNGDGSFSEVALPEHPRADGGWTTSVAIGDITGDHLPEIFEVNYLDDPTGLTISCGSGTIACNPASFLPAANQVLSVQPDGTIHIADACEDIENRANYGFGIVIANFDKKAGNDVFIANDTQENHFWVSQASTSENLAPRLIESGAILGCASSQNGLARGCMGIAFGDFDRNQALDLYVSNFWKQAADLYLMQDSGSFTSGNYRLGMFEDSVDTVGWGTQAADFNHDGWLDVAVLNGHVTDLSKRGQPFEMRPQMFQGGAEGFTFIKPIAQGPNTYWSEPTLGRTMALIDWNRDGRMDLVTNHLDRPVALLENQTQVGSANSVRIELVGTQSERDAIGAVVTLQAQGETWTAWQTGGDGFLCSNQNQLHIGVGDRLEVELVTIQWPSGITQTFDSVATGASYVAIEGRDELFSRD